MAPKQTAQLTNQTNKPTNQFKPSMLAPCATHAVGFTQKVMPHIPTMGHHVMGKMNIRCWVP